MSKQLLDTTSKHTFSVAGSVDRLWNYISETALKTGWPPLTRLAESAVIALMNNITTGRLRVLSYSNSEIYDFPSSNGSVPYNVDQSKPKGELRIVNEVFWLRLCAMGDLGFAESYMYGEVECDDLVSLFHLFLDNRDRLSNLDSRISYLFTLPSKITSFRFLNTIGNSRSNISAHYDISNEMFAGFLSRDMTYSCAIFADLDGDLKCGLDTSDWSGGQGLKRIGIQHPNPTLASDIDPEDELYDAQIRKLQHIINKAKINRGNRVLEIGSGWGSMAILIASTIPDTRVDTLTLSIQQQTLAQERIAAAGLSNRVSVHLMDYRNMPLHWKGVFDRVVSIEMIEAVGSEFLATYWKQVDWAMKPKNGVGVVQVITIPEARFERYMREIDFIRKWIFPGGFLPTLTFLLQTLQEGSHGRLTVDSVSNIGPHYARTLREWRRRFLDRFESVVVPSLQKEYPDVMSGPLGRTEMEVFKRKWIYYYCYCEVGFTTRTLGDHIISFTREGCPEYGCNTYE